MNNVPTPCPGRCNSAWRAAENRYDKTGIDHNLEPTDGQPVWCPPCTTALRAAVSDMPDLAGRLREEIESGVSAAMTEYVSGSKNRPIHDHEAESLLLDEFARWIADWEDTIRAEHQLADRRTITDPAAAIEASCTFLLPHLDWHLAGRAQLEYGDVTGADIAANFGRELIGYYRSAQRLTGTQDPDPVRCVGVLCPICDRKSLEEEVEDEPSRRQWITRFRYGADGEALTFLRPRPDKITERVIVPVRGATTGYIRCCRCRPTFRMSPDEYQQWTQMLAAHEQTRALATRERLAEIFGGSVPVQYRAVC